MSTVKATFLIRFIIDIICYSYQFCFLIKGIICSQSKRCFIEIIVLGIF